MQKLLLALATLASALVVTILPAEAAAAATCEDPDPLVGCYYLDGYKVCWRRGNSLACFGPPWE